MVEPHAPKLSLWIGPAYEHGWNGTKLLLVAEALPEVATGFRIGRGLEAALMDSYLDGSMKNRQFTDVARLVLGRAAEREDCEHVLAHLAFVNLPQVPMRVHPTETDWAAARRTLSAVVDDLQPGVVLLLGRRLSEELAPELEARSSPPRVLSIPHPGTENFDFRDHLEQTSVLHRPRA